MEIEQSIEIITLVVDANIIISSLIANGRTAELIVNSALELYTPDFVAKELFKYKDYIASKTKRSIESYNMTIQDIFRIVKIVPEEEAIDYLAKAPIISPDPKDDSYFSIALKLKCPIWSNDALLKEQDKVKVISTTDLIKILEI